MSAPVLVVRRISPETIRLTFGVQTLCRGEHRDYTRLEEHHFDFSLDRARDLARAIDAEADRNEAER